MRDADGHPCSARAGSVLEGADDLTTGNGAPGAPDLPGHGRGAVPTIPVLPKGVWADSPKVGTPSPQSSLSAETLPNSNYQLHVPDREHLGHELERSRQGKHQA
jgi:hypothetical protein